MLIIFIRTVILYFAILVSMRLMGKRQLGEMELSEFIVAALTADLAATPLQDIGTPMINGIVPIITLFCFEILIAGVSLRSIKLRGFIFGKPEILIKNGKIDQKEMKRNRFTTDELMQELREQSINDITQIAYAVLETNGNLNVILKPESQPLTPENMNIPVENKGYPHIIINEGRILDNNLRILGRDRSWLKKQLGGKDPDAIYLLTVSETGSIFLQEKE